MSPAVDGAGDREVRFGPFRVVASQRLVEEANIPLRLGSRAQNMLFALLERAGEVVSKAELLSKVWPDTFVDEANLKVQVAALRRALGDGQHGRRYIVNVPGLGYSFVAPIETSSAETFVGEVASSSGPAFEPTVVTSRMIGRAETVPILSDMLRQHRFVSIVGPGGIGKTTVAVAVAESAFSSRPQQIYYVDLSTVADLHLVPASVASALGIGLRSEDPVKDLIARLRDKQILIVLDSCEHVIGQIASLAERLFSGTGPGLHLLATSREPLRVAGERVYRLPPLTCPPSGNLSAADAMAFPAVQLFVERAAATVDGFVLTDEEAPVLAELCRRLDGMALALEITAGHAGTFGITGLTTQLDDHYRLILQGRRTATSRHRTHYDALDWSYALLAEGEKRALRHLSVVPGAFTIAAAVDLLEAADASSAVIVDTLANLVSKSLLAADVHRAVASYRLLDTTRAYASAKLAESGERAEANRRYALHVRDGLERAETEWHVLPAAQWLERHRRLIDDVRATLEWAYAPEGDPDLGSLITTLSIPLWFQSGLITECGERVRRALAFWSPLGGAQVEMRLHAAHAWSLMQTRGQVAATEAAWERTLELAEALDEPDFQLRALWGLWSGLLNRGELGLALTMAQRFEALATARGQPADAAVADRIIGYILHLLGDQAEARARLERMLETYVAPSTGAEAIRFIFDQRATAQSFLARILWLQGQTARARRLVEKILDDASETDDPLSLCQVLVQAACPIAILSEDWDDCERHVTTLLDVATRNGLEFWRLWGECFHGVLVARKVDPRAGARMLEAALDGLRGIQYGVYYVVFQAEYARALGTLGLIDQALAAIDQAISRSEQNQERWYAAELLRIKGELLLQDPASSDDHAEQLFETAFDLAESQSASSLQLRAAMSLSRSWLKKGQVRRGLDLLGAFTAKIGEGSDLTELQEARALLRDLEAAARSAGSSFAPARVDGAVNGETIGSRRRDVFAGQRTGSRQVR